MRGRALRNQPPGVPSLTSPSRHIGNVFFFKVPPDYRPLRSSP